VSADTGTADVAQLSGLEILRARASQLAGPGIWRLLGMEVDEIEFGAVTFGVTTTPDFANPLGSVHGGVCATLLDSAMGCAVHSTLDPGDFYTTLELKVNYVRAVPVDGARLTARGTTVHVGRRTATAEGRVTDQTGALVAHATTTCLIRRR
jgi:uncharacterized protein (TIGR00369 family)